MPLNSGLFSTKPGVGTGARVIFKAPVVEQMLSKTGAGDLLQKLLGNDRVRIDVRGIQRRNNAGVAE
ncbi:Uncharacterised protein [Pantoea agglomerans]|uniref:Uncharacterized protein n=1 Tax=Enterobacter agglomerans TaxID=549 RepID=A0A379AKX2_ENTAG|nr:Uncharacterised protein [Pantoea agglomerans]